MSLGSHFGLWVAESHKWPPKKCQDNFLSTSVDNLHKKSRGNNYAKNPTTAFFVTQGSVLYERFCASVIHLRDIIHLRDYFELSSLSKRCIFCVHIGSAKGQYTVWQLFYISDYFFKQLFALLFFGGHFNFLNSEVSWTASILLKKIVKPYNDYTNNRTPDQSEALQTKWCPLQSREITLPASDLSIIYSWSVRWDGREMTPDADQSPLEHDCQSDGELSILTVIYFSINIFIQRNTIWII